MKVGDTNRYAYNAQAIADAQAKSDRRLRGDPTGKRHRPNWRSMIEQAFGKSGRRRGMETRHRRRQSATAAAL